LGSLHLSHHSKFQHTLSANELNAKIIGRYSGSRDFNEIFTILADCSCLMHLHRVLRYDAQVPT